MKFKLRHRIILISITAAITAYGYIHQSSPSLSISPYPNGKNFAFTITDDPDETRLEKITPIYEFLDSLGIRTTIACWVYKPEDLRGMPDPQEQEASETLANYEYLNFLKKYQYKGFEIALHTVTSGNDKRKVTMEGYENFKEIFLEYPKINIMHSKNRENIYWGRNVFANRLMRMAVGLYDRIPYGGEDPNSAYFWGDICKEKTKYIRLWGTSDINTLKFNPSMPYHDLKKPLVNYWFSFSDGYSVKFFNKLLSENNVKRLIKERGACIVYTHFAAGFCKKQLDDKYALNDITKRELLFLTHQKDGWFVPASEILDRLLETKKIIIVKKSKSVVITNLNPRKIPGVTLITKRSMPYTDESGKIASANEEGEIALGDLQPMESKIIYISGNIRVSGIAEIPRFWENMGLVWQRLKIMILQHRG